MNTENESLTVRLPKGMKALLGKTAAEQDLTVSQLVRRLLATRRKPARRAKKKEAA